MNTIRILVEAKCQKKDKEDERRNQNLKSYEIKAWIFFKEILFFNQFLFLFNHNKISFQKWNMYVGFKGPSHLTWVPFGQFLIMKMSWSKFSIPILDYFILVMTLATIKFEIHFISNWKCYDAKDLTSQEIDMGKLHCMFAHQTNGFSIYVGRTNNHQNNYNLFFKVDTIASSLDTIYPKKICHLQLSLVLLFP